MYLHDFSSIMPPFSSSQEEGLNWIAQIHTEAESQLNPSFERDVFLSQIKRLIQKVCCKKESVSKRYVCINDMIHLDWKKMQIFNLASLGPEGCGFGERGRFYAAFADKVFEQFYPEKAAVPDEMIHVTCTGYNAPSSAQKLVARRQWQTSVTHAYHMGCAGALPAIRIGSGFAHLRKSQVDIVHTELSSLHFNPASHTAEQLVGQSLFADGFIKYTLSQDPKKKTALRIIAFHESFIPNSEKLMQWECEDWGLRMTLSREIPALIGEHIESFLSVLGEKSGSCLKKAFYAIHPGGPKIIGFIQNKLSLEDWQVEATKQILYERGNMSSATLPHIWEIMIADPKIPAGSIIVGLAFAPGLCVSGIVLKKEEL